MGFRFQRRLKLFPGVRLNFSRSGISTTIGIPGAGITLGGSGAYVNLGIPGTGVSFREKLAQWPPKSSETWNGYPTVEPAPTTSPHPQETEIAGAIRSGPVSTMTSAGLDELKKLINEASLKRIELRSTVSQSEVTLDRERRRLHHAQWFIVRLFTRRALPKLREKVHEAACSLTIARQRLAGCSVEIDFAFDPVTLNSFAALVRSFEGLTKSQKIWDVTASVLANRFVERTIAHHSLTRKLVGLSISRSEIIDTAYDALRITNANGSDLYIYPGFVMVPSTTSDFALIDVRELQVKFSQSNFIEEEGVPPDSEVVGETWKKTNKDGKRDRRFANNYQIPIAKYAEIELRSSSGLYEVYQFSNFVAASAFNQSLLEYQNAVTALSARSNDPSGSPLVVPPHDPAEDAEADLEVMSEAEAVSQRAPARFLAFDWLALVVLISALGWAGVYLAARGDNIRAAMLPPVQQQVLSAAPAIEIPVVANVPVPLVRPNQAPVASATPALGPTAAKAPTAPTGREVVYVLKPSVNIRSEPSTTAKVVGSAKAARKLNVFQRQSEWVQVGEGGPIGWVHQSLLGAVPP
jgi:hypothetical protein